MAESIQIFTDGASKGNPGRGGYGAVIARDTTIIELGGFKERTTNNEMELRAVVEALKAIQDTDATVAIYTDSKYVVEGANGWIFGWIKKRLENQSRE